MINLGIQAKGEDDIGTINAWVDSSASIDDMREAWKYALDGTLKSQVYNAIFQACFNQGIDPKTILTEIHTNGN